jgi:hypothetical protein
MTRSILILSNKSSGSSAVQRLLAQAIDLKCLKKTRHFENESLYWTKAASALNLPQRDMLDSEVPISPEMAQQDLIQLLQDNLPAGRLSDLPAQLLDNQLLDSQSLYRQPLDKSFIFEGWQRLCEQFAPTLLEKSPHHLLQWSALTLIMECMAHLEGEVDFLLIGLVRNPMDTLYSAFRRWRTPPEALQYEWLSAYRNLRKLAEQLGDRVVIVRYEDLVTSLDPLAPVFDFCDAAPSASARCLNRHSLLKWQQDPDFGFSLAPEVNQLARSYGYSEKELANAPSRFWPLYRDLSRSLYQHTRWGKDLYFSLKRSDLW